MVGITLNSPLITRHAKERAQQRFGISPKDAQKWFAKKAELSSFLTVSIQRDGSKRRLFSVGDTILVVDYTDDRIITVYSLAENQMKEADESIRQFARNQIAQSERMQNRTLRELAVLRAKIEREIAERQAQLRRARSIAKKIACQARIIALETRLSDLPNERIAAQKEHVIKSRGFARVI